MRKYFLFFLGFVLCFFRGMAQLENNTPTATPNAASLGVYGQIPVDYFTGTPQIDIPLYTYKSRDLSVPIGLSYHSASFRPGDHPSWVGLGWTLQAGGQITRIQNDLPDELIDLFPGVTLTNRGFFYSFGTLGSDWGSLSNMENAESAYEVQTYGAWSQGSTHNRPDYAPDEFQFNFLGMSGSLFYGQDRAWHLKSKQGLHFDVTPEIGPYAVWEPSLNTQIQTQNYPSLVQNCLTGFILQAADGTTYYFGTQPATDMNSWRPTADHQYFSVIDSNAVEFSRVGTGYSNQTSSARDGGAVPMTWYLTKIVSATGDYIVFRYTRDGPQYNINTETFGTFYECQSCNPKEYYTYGAGDVVSILDGTTLSSISGANGTIQFAKSQANTLNRLTLIGAPISPQNSAWNTLYEAYMPEIFQQIGSSTNPAINSVYMELDKLKVLDNYGNPVKSFAFNYITSPTNRFWLNSVTETGADGSTLPPYSFTYNNTAGLNNVPYNTVQVDHWGYFTGKDPFAGLFTLTSVEPVTLNGLTGSGFYNTFSNGGTLYTTGFNSTFNAGYVANRNPVDGPLEYGILQQITFPTGGSTQFTWQPNKYSKCINGTLGSAGVTPSVQDLGADVSGPGVRIWQITSQAGYNAPAVTKTYTYYRDPVNNNYTSSGVLNAAQPSYCTEYDNGSTYTYRDWSGQNVNGQHYTDGAPMGYTNVQENYPDGSYTNFTFTNQDNGYLDQAAQSYITTLSSLSPVLQQLGLTSMELARGLLLTESKYATGAVLPLSQTTRQYNIDPNQWGTPIYRYAYSPKFALVGTSVSFDGGGFLSVSSGPPIYFGDFTSASAIHYDYPYLKSETVTNYDQNEANPMSVVTNYSYDGYRNKTLESYTSSKNEPVEKDYSYASNTGPGVQGAMVTAGMVGIPLEQVEKRNGTQTEHWRMDYQQYATTGKTMLVPGQSYKASYTASPEPLTQYLSYDNFGNINEYITQDGLTTCYDWGYNQAYPVVKITNATNSGTKNYFYEGFEENNNSAVAGGTAHTGDMYWGGNSYTPGFTPPDNNAYTIEWWALESGNWVYHTQGYSAGMSVTGPVDDVRIFPAGAMMSTYTYRPLVGMTSEIDPKGYTSYYTYDAFARLSGELDKDRNVLKRYCYNYTGQPGTCPVYTTPPIAAVDVANTTNQASVLTFTNTTTNSTLTYTIAAGAQQMFPVPSGPYTVTLTPANINVSYPIIYTFNGYVQTSYGTVAYGGGTISGTTAVTIAPPAYEPINVTNTSTEPMVLTFVYNPGSYTYNYVFNVPANYSGTIGYVPYCTSYTSYIAPQQPNQEVLYTFNYNGYIQTSYGSVEYGGGGITSPVNIVVNPLPPCPIYVSNSTNRFITVTYTNTSTNEQYFWSVDPNTPLTEQGTIPQGTYTLTVGPTSVSQSYVIEYNANGSIQITYGTVLYGATQLSGTQTINVSPHN